MINFDPEELNRELDDQFTLLEQRITRTIRELEELKGKNSRLSSKLEAEERKSQQLESQIKELQDKAAEADHWKNQAQELIQLREKVTGKIENLLSRINDLSSDHQ